VDLTARDLSKLHHLEFRNREALDGRRITGVSTDSRTIKSGDLFFALKGENFDGHKFIAEVVARGAAAVVVEVSANVPSRHPTLVVKSTVRAFGELAHLVRKRCTLPLIAIGGSNGKTTTKEMITHVLRSRYRVLATEGNLNNHLGVPQTIFRLDEKDEIAVVEIGTNHPGEIRSLCRILEPTHGLITNVGKEHLEFFGSIEGVAREEADLYKALTRRKATVAFVNADDPNVAARAKGVARRVTYGFGSQRVAVKGKLLGMDDAGCCRFQFTRAKTKRTVRVQLAVPGEHNAYNALAAAAVGVAFEVPFHRIRHALQEFHSASKRMEVLNVKGVVIYNDTYNANPDSTVAALRTVARAQVRGKRIAVLADMLELGSHATEEHLRVGKEVAALGFDYLLTYGEKARHMHDAASMPYAVHYQQKNMLAEYLAELVGPGDAVLVKGSRGMKMEDIVVFLEERLRSAVVPFG
jgi:UDP-N-acetylmuramoyl-tripeptide--D-alanyl-D-alanine ligase